MIPGALRQAVDHAYDANHAVNLVESLAASAIFAGLDWEDIARLAQHAEWCTYTPLEEALVEGERPRELNVVVRGRFIVLLPSQQLDRHGAGAVVNLDSFVSGDCFGHSGLVDDVVAPASIIATEESETIAIPLAALVERATEDARIGRIIYSNLFAIQTRRLVLLAG